MTTRRNFIVAGLATALAPTAMLEFAPTCGVRSQVVITTATVNGMRMLWIDRALTRRETKLACEFWRREYGDDSNIEVRERKQS